MPDVFTAADVTGDDIRHMVPAINPGAARLVPTGFSNFDEKFSYIRYLNNVDFNGDEEEILAQGQGTLFPHFILIEDGVFDLPTLKARLEIAGETQPAADYQQRPHLSAQRAAAHRRSTPRSW